MLNRVMIIKWLGLFVCCLGAAIAAGAQPVPIPTSQWVAIYRFNEGTGTNNDGCVRE